MSAQSRRLWVAWIFANAWGELVGLSAVAVVGWVAMVAIGEPSSLMSALGIALLFIGLGAVEGAIVGFAQGNVLRAYLPRARWIEATVLGAAAAWALGMAPSTIASLISPGAPSTPAIEMSPLLEMALAAALGLVAGPVLAWPQWRVLRHTVSGAGWWPVANAVAWCVGMPVIFAGMGFAWHATLPHALWILALTFATTGALVGAIEGAALQRLFGELDPMPAANARREGSAIPVSVSARHAHLTQATIDKLFGTGHQLSPRIALWQPGQYAAHETITLVGPRSRLEHVRVLGPPRVEDQIEISRSDEIALGLHVPIRLSGDLQDTPGITLIGPAGRVKLSHGVVCARRHIHMGPFDARRFGVRDHDVVQVAIDSDGRDLVFGDVVVRVSPDYRLEMHIDTDEGNAAGFGPGSAAVIARITRREETGAVSQGSRY